MNIINKLKIIFKWYCIICSLLSIAVLNWYLVNFYTEQVNGQSTETITAINPWDFDKKQIYFITGNSNGIAAGNYEVIFDKNRINRVSTRADRRDLRITGPDFQVKYQIISITQPENANTEIWTIKFPNIQINPIEINIWGAKGKIAEVSPPSAIFTDLQTFPDQRLVYSNAQLLRSFPQISFRSRITVAVNGTLRNTSTIDPTLNTSTAIVGMDYHRQPFVLGRQIYSGGGFRVNNGVFSIQTLPNNPPYYAITENARFDNTLCATTHNATGNATIELTRDLYLGASSLPPPNTPIIYAIRAKLNNSYYTVNQFTCNGQSFRSSGIVGPRPDGQFWLLKLGNLFSTIISIKVEIRYNTIRDATNIILIPVAEYLFRNTDISPRNTDLAGNLHYLPTTGIGDAILVSPARPNTNTTLMPLYQTEINSDENFINEQLIMETNNVNRRSLFGGTIFNFSVPQIAGLRAIHSAFAGWPGTAEFYWIILTLTLALTVATITFTIAKRRAEAIFAFLLTITIAFGIGLIAVWVILLILGLLPTVMTFTRDRRA